MELRISKHDLGGTHITLTKASIGCIERKTLNRVLKRFGKHLQVEEELCDSVTYAIRGCVPTVNWLFEVTCKFPHIKVVREQ